MDTINLGMEWDATADLDAALKTEQERAKNSQGENGKKLTPAQKREAAFVEIAQSIEHSDWERVDEILIQQPKLVFNMGSYGAVYKALIENFNIAVAKKLIERKLPMNTYSLYQHLGNKHNAALLDYFIERCTTENETHWLQNLYMHTIKGFTGNVSEQQRRDLREQRAVLEKLDPQSLVKSVHRDHFFHIFTTYTVLPDVEKKALETLTQEDWEKSFDAWFASFKDQRYRPSAKIGLKTFKNVLRFLNDTPPARAGWERAVKNLSVQNQVYKDFIAQYFKPEETYSDSQLAKNIKTFSSRYSNPPFPFQQLDAQQKLGLTWFEMQELGAADWEYIELKAVNGVAPLFEVMPAYAPPSFVHILVKTASPASLALLESEAGKKVYWECLQEPSVLKSWCLKASQETINMVVRACPEMLQWSDKHNNSVGHYLVFLRAESSQAFGQLIARLNHNWILQENDQGVSVKVLLKSFGATENTLNSLDKEAIKRSMKDAGIKKTRRTDPAPKRRM